MFHNYMVGNTSRLLAAVGWRIYLEYRIRQNGIINDVDILAVLNSCRVIFEIETTARHILDNCSKAQAVGIPLCIVVPTIKVYKAAVKQTRNIALKPAGVPITIFTLQQLPQELTAYLSFFIAANSHTDK